MRSSIKIFIIFTIALVTFQTSAFSQAKELKLWYDKPTGNWNEALPVGNGRLGAMVYGGVTQELIQFNEETLWTGSPHDYSNEGAFEYLDEIRNLLFRGEQKEAEELAAREFMSEPVHLKSYQPFGDLIIDFPGHKDHSNYYRELDIANAIHNTYYEVDGVAYRREVFASKPHQVIVIRLSTDRPGTLSFGLRLDSKHYQKSLDVDGNTQQLDIKVTDGVLNGRAKIKVVTDGKLIPRYESTVVSNASEAVIYLSAYTNFLDYRNVGGSPSNKLKQTFEDISSQSYEQIKAMHQSDYKELFDRFKLDFVGRSRVEVPTDKRILKFWKDPNDPQLLALYVQYARYLMISSSRSGTQPANLQGIWNSKLNPAWGSKYTTNINFEMNYWLAESTNLSECHEPLFKLIEEVAQTGALVAKNHYGAHGWVLHHNTDIWRAAAPINKSNHGIWVTGGAWLCAHLWEHYQYTQDKKFLKEKYPLIKGAALFFTQFLIKDPKTGHLVSSPSNSPETGGLVAGPTMDHQLIRNLFRICIKSSKILDIDHEFATKLERMVVQIAPNQIGRLGQLQEWLEDKDDPELKHRHISHLWGIHPGNEINWKDSPDLMKGAKQSLEYRGDAGTGWSLGWKVNFWARLLDGNHAYKLLHALLSPAEHPERNARGGSYPNLLDAHPPFQIDGNFGGAAGILETLVQSHLETIDLLPALPDALPNGKISGLRVRGGFELSFEWRDGQLIDLEVLSHSGNDCKLRYAQHAVKVTTEKNEVYKFNNKLILRQWK